MERRADIRAALHNLLSRSLPPDTTFDAGAHLASPSSSEKADPPREQAPPPEPAFPPAPPSPPAVAAFQIAGGDLLLTDEQWVVLKGVRDQLGNYGISSETPQVIQALVDVVTKRPALCRQLMALYLLKG